MAVAVGSNRRILTPDSVLLEAKLVEVPVIEAQDIIHQRHDQSIVRRDDLSSQVLSYSARRRILEFDIQKLAQPQGLTSGLLVLGFVAGFAGPLIYIYFSFGNLHERSGSRRKSAGTLVNMNKFDRGRQSRE